MKWSKLYTDPIKNGGVIYAAQYEDGLVKIGYTTWLLRRVSELEENYRGRRCNVVKLWATEKLDKPYKLEKCIHSMLTPAEKKELYNISFERAIGIIKSEVLLYEVAKGWKKIGRQW